VGIFSALYNLLLSCIPCGQMCLGMICNMCGIGGCPAALDRLCLEPCILWATLDNLMR
jgi:hypothetical protein